MTRSVGSGVAATLTSTYWVSESEPRMLWVPTVDPSTQTTESDPSAAVVRVVDAAPLTVPPPAVTATVMLLPPAGRELPSLSIAVTVNTRRIGEPADIVVGGGVFSAAVYPRTTGVNG